MNRAEQRTRDRINERALEKNPRAKALGSLSRTEKTGEIFLLRLEKLTNDLGLKGNPEAVIQNAHAVKDIAKAMTLLDPELKQDELVAFLSQLDLSRPQWPMTLSQAIKTTHKDSKLAALLKDPKEAINTVGNTLQQKLVAQLNAAVPDSLVPGGVWTDVELQGSHTINALKEGLRAYARLFAKDSSFYQQQATMLVSLYTNLDSLIHAWHDGSCTLARLTEDYQVITNIAAGLKLDKIDLSPEKLATIQQFFAKFENRAARPGQLKRELNRLASQLGLEINPAALAKIKELKKGRWTRAKGSMVALVAALGLFAACTPTPGNPGETETPTEVVNPPTSTEEATNTVAPTETDTATSTTAPTETNTVQPTETQTATATPGFVDASEMVTETINGEDWHNWPSYPITITWDTGGPETEGTDWPRNEWPSNLIVALSNGNLDRIDRTRVTNYVNENFVFKVNPDAFDGDSSSILDENGNIKFQGTVDGLGRFRCELPINEDQADQVVVQDKRYGNAEFKFNGKTTLYPIANDVIIAAWTFDGNDVCFDPRGGNGLTAVRIDPETGDLTITHETNGGFTLHPLEEPVTLLAAEVPGNLTARWHDLQVGGAETGVEAGATELDKFKEECETVVSIDTRNPEYAALAEKYGEMSFTIKFYQEGKLKSEELGALLLDPDRVLEYVTQVLYRAAQNSNGYTGSYEQFLAEYKAGTIAVNIPNLIDEKTMALNVPGISINARDFVITVSGQEDLEDEYTVGTQYQQGENAYSELGIYYNEDEPNTLEFFVRITNDIKDEPDNVLYRAMSGLYTICLPKDKATLRRDTSYGLLVDNQLESNKKGELFYQEFSGRGGPGPNYGFKEDSEGPAIWFTRKGKVDPFIERFLEPNE